MLGRDGCRYGEGETPRENPGEGDGETARERTGRGEADMDTDGGLEG